MCRKCSSYHQYVLNQRSFRIDIRLHTRMIRWPSMWAPNQNKKEWAEHFLSTDMPVALLNRNSGVEYSICCMLWNKRERNKSQSKTTRDTQLCVCVAWGSRGWSKTQYAALHADESHVLCGVMLSGLCDITICCNVARDKLSHNSFALHWWWCILFGVCPIFLTLSSLGSGLFLYLVTLIELSFFRHSPHAIDGDSRTPLAHIFRFSWNWCVCRSGFVNFLALSIAHHRHRLQIASFKCDTSYRS